MDDLLGEDWQAPAKAQTSTPLKPISNTSVFSSFRASPQPSTGAASPQNTSRPTSTVNGNKSAVNDHFESLLGGKAQKSGGNVSLLDRQRQMMEEKRRQQEQNTQLWDTLGSGRGTPEIRGPSPAISTNQDEEEDILAAFNQDAPVNKASHFPPPPQPVQDSEQNNPSNLQPAPEANVASGGFEDDDDPFGLSSMPHKLNGHAKAPATTRTDDDDILGDLGKPFIERQPSPEPARRPHAGALAANEDSEDRALAELVDMGFPAETAKIALAENNGDVQHAVGWLLRQAHEESKQKVREEAEGRRKSPGRSPHEGRSGDSTPAWARQKNDRADSSTRRQDSRSAANADAGTAAQDFSSKLFKSANSLWKASQKQMAKTMAEFQQERDSSQPRWMSEASDSSRASGQRRPVQNANLTDEAAMLDAPRESRPIKSSAQAPSEMPSDSRRGRMPAEPLPHRSAPQSKFMQQPQQDRSTATKLSRQEVEEHSAQAYVSPARRKKPTPQPAPQPEPEVDLFTPAPFKSATPQTATKPSSQARSVQSSASKPSAPPRNVPAISQSALSTSAQHRKKGGDAFKRGDYATAHEAYTAALTPLPAKHPIMIIVLSNRALTALKTGDPKVAISDADRAIEIIGSSQGVNESIDLGAGEGVKDMREFYGKAVMRKAEALENLEKWNDAAAAWNLAIEAGAGGAIAIRGRDRCKKATAPKAATAAPKAVQSYAPKPGKAPPAKGLGDSLQRPALSSIASGEAVKKLREANAAAEKADDEKFALSDQVDAKLTSWKGGKADNLRALLQSLDGVLWTEAGWKKVGMSDLVMPNKVKIVYMKAIAKVHPDKIPQNATTEQRMISAAVFATLNEAWDKFKKDNNL